ncbi:hypothetical protein HGO21_08325 [Acinetobacter sp. CUI P1]|nr:hypothetical protein [Acinetobacter sp. CUI P1]
MIVLYKLIAQDINLEIDAAYDDTIANRQTVDLQIMSDPIKSYFIKHIDNSNKASYKKVCKFNHAGALVYTECVEVLANIDDDDVFISASVAMTRSLHTAMRSSTSRSSGTMLYMIYEDTVTNDKYFGIFKMDRNDAIEFNRVTNTFVLHNNILPTLREKLHKTAIVKLKNNLLNEQIHLYVMDKQQSADVGPSKFFLNMFLEAEEVMNNQVATDVVSSTIKLMAAAGEINGVTTPIQFNQELNFIMTRGRDFDFDVEIERLLTSYIPGEADREREMIKIKEKIQEKDPDIPLQFKVQCRQPKTTYTDVNKQIKLQFPTVYGEVDKISVNYDGEDTTIVIKGVKLDLQ